MRVNPYQRYMFGILGVIVLALTVLIMVGNNAAARSYLWIFGFLFSTASFYLALQKD